MLRFSAAINYYCFTRIHAATPLSMHQLRLTHWSQLTTALLMWIANTAGKLHISHLTRFLMTSNKYTDARMAQKSCSELLSTA